MELNKKNVRTIIGIIILTLLIAAGLMNYVELWGTLFWVVSLIFPFILGGCLAFILNIPMRLIEKYVFSEKRVKNKHIKKLARPISMLLSIILVLVLIIVIMFLIVPEIARTVGVLQQSFPAFIKTVQEWVNNLAGSHSEIANALKNFSIDWKNMES
ncbi:MAG: AI-2E family transporter, partial [Eubacterium sp.]